MRFQSADDVAAAYFAGLEALTPLRAVDLRMIVAEKCSHCRGGPSTEKIGRYVRSKVTGELLPERHTVCSTCGRDWEPEPWGSECILRGEIQANGRPSVAEEAVLRIVFKRLHFWPKLVRCVEQRPDAWSRASWRDALGFWRSHLVVGSYEGVAEAARMHGVTVYGHEVGRVLRDARVVVERRAKRPENALLRRAA